jgi:hypothetical protein
MPQHIGPIWNSDMKTIYKYPVVDGAFKAPYNIRIIRQDHVDDGFYKGDFVWGIVDSYDKADHLFVYNPDKHLDAEYLSQFMRVPLPVKEKQSITCGKPIYAGETDGIINIYTAGEIKPRQIVLYKTGQEITEPIEKLRYIGLNRLWIIQELGLYTFEVME